MKRLLLTLSLALLLEDPALGRDVPVHAAVPVEMAREPIRPREISFPPRVLLVADKRHPILKCADRFGDLNCPQ